MKIVLIHGQNHKGSSYHIGRMLADNLAVGDLEEFFLPGDLEHFCIGCYKCIDHEENCPFYQEKNRIMTAVESADLLIFTTPTYCLRASAPMKAFIDLTFTYWMVHRPRTCMFSKKAVVISTAAGSGVKSAIKDVSNTLFYWGVPYVKQYGIALQAMSWEGVSMQKKEKIQRDIKKLAKQITRKSKVHVGLKTKFIFEMMRIMQRKGWGSGPAEKEYWQDKGWLGGKRPWM